MGVPELRKGIRDMDRTLISCFKVKRDFKSENAYSLRITNREMTHREITGK